MYKTIQKLMFCSFVFFTACQQQESKTEHATDATQKATEKATSEVASSSQELKQTLDGILDDIFTNAPESVTWLGVPDEKYVKYQSMLSSYNKDAENNTASLNQKALEKLGAIDQTNLSIEEKTHIWVLQNAFGLAVERENFSFGSKGNFGASSPYIVTPISGEHNNLPQLLLVQQPLGNMKEVKAFLSRLNMVSTVLSQVKEKVLADAENGIVLPDFALKNTVDGLNQFVATGVEKSSLVTVFGTKLDAIDGITAEDKTKIIDKVKTIVADDIFPAYTALASALKSIEDKASEHAGIWAQPNGEEFYKLALKNYGAGSLSADDIHEIGLSETKRIHKEMDVILKTMGYEEGDAVKNMIKATEQADSFYEDSDEGREELLEELRTQISDILALSDQYFMDLPPYDVEVRRIPPYEEVTAPGGYYTSPAIDGSRPGTYWINLYNIKDWAKYRLKTLTYHEAVPGHHFQLSTQLDIDGFPLIRQLLYYSEYGEGWALYAEKLAKEMGMYENDPEGDLGRLQAELFRAGRLVVDTGMHHKKWSREEAIKWLHENTGEPINAATREIERYSVWPGQATSYKLGMLKIDELKQKAKDQLGDNFDIRTFHKLVLSVGGAPLPVLEQRFDLWLSQQ